MEQGQAVIDLPDYLEYWNSAEKKGYSGTAIFTRRQPLAASLGVGEPEHDREGRVITLEYADFYLVNVYTPNAQRGLARLGYRMEWEDVFRAYLLRLDEKKPVIVCGDMNVAHKEIDLKNPKSNVMNAGFSPEERAKMTVLQDSGFTDTFRARYPDKEHAYTWWSYMRDARAKNVGWRIDYFLVSRRVEGQVKDAMIFPEIYGSDHCPIGLEIDEIGAGVS